MSFRVRGLPADQFSSYAAMSHGELARLGVERVSVRSRAAAPCRVSLEDAEPGERVLLLNYEHQPAATPYRSRHAIFVREGAVEAVPEPGEVPEALRTRLLSVRSFDEAGRMLDADVADGTALEPLVERLFAEPETAYLHVHYARRGCYAARVDRA